jgi:hypothetical protein
MRQAGPLAADLQRPLWAPQPLGEAPEQAAAADGRTETEKRMAPARNLDLARLLWPVEPEAFFRDTWEKKHLTVARNDPGYYGGLFSLPDVDALIAFTRPAVVDPVEMNRAPASPKSFVRGWLPGHDAEPPEIYPNLGELRSLYAQGKTVIITAVEHRWHPVALLCRNLEAVFHCPVQANMYLTPGRAQGFSAHYDTHDVFIVQVEGRKHWRLYGAAESLPVDGDAVGVPRDRLGPPQEVCLEAGDLLYLPRGHAHEAFTSECASLHLTVGVYSYRWTDLVRAALMSVSQRDVRFRESLPAGWMANGGSVGPVRDRLQELLKIVAEEARAEDALGLLGARFLSELRPLPHGAFVPRDADGVGLDTVVEKNAGMVCRVVAQGDGIAIQFPGNQVAGPAKVASALHFIACTPRFAVRTLPDDLTADGKLVLVKRLVREGLLTVAAAAPPRAD